MSQNNVNFGVDPTGSQLLDELLTDEQQNNLTVHGGTVRPEYAMVGTIWTDKSVEGVATLKRFNGTSDDVLLSVNSVEGVATVEKALLYNSKYKYSKNAVVINATDSEVKLYKSLVADNVGNALSDVDSWEEISLGGGVDLNTGDKIYDWIGTKAEYEEQQIETLHPEYLCFITDDETPVVCATRSLDNLDEAGQAKFDAKADVSALAAIIKAGTLIPFAGSTPPEGWLKCDGSAISRTTYTTLFAVIGTTYGVGDGSTTFNLPNLMNVKLLKGSSVQVKGNGMTLGLTNGSGNYGLKLGVAGTNQGLGILPGTFGTGVGTSSAQGGTSILQTIGVTTDPTKSGIIADISSGVSVNYIIKY